MKIPRTGSARQSLRLKGQFWTPDWVAQAMVAYALRGGSDTLFDPAVGAGVFFRAGRRLAGSKLRLIGNEIDASVLQQALASGLSADDLREVQVTDFVLNPPAISFPAIVANPPYIRHHSLSTDTKRQLQVLANSLLGTGIDGRAGLHIYFLLRALQLLLPNGNLAFIMPADTCEGVFSSKLWNWITKHYCLEAIVTFAPEASPFQGVDTNPIIFMIKNSLPTQNFWWAKCMTAQTDELERWVGSGFSDKNASSLQIHLRSLTEGLSIGFSRPPSQIQVKAESVLGNFARVMRGVATGANEFFFLTDLQAQNLAIPSEFLHSAVGRTRDVDGDEVNLQSIEKLKTKGRPTLLFSPDGRQLNQFPLSIQQYLRQGEELGINQRVLLATRRPWYKMEVRAVPPILFAYLGRRNVRFIRNFAQTIPLTGFLCVYPHQDDADFITKLWQILNHPETIANLALVGKSYGSGAIKVEPRSLENLPLSKVLLERVGLLNSNEPKSCATSHQMSFWET